jgi:hypothetical protein
MLTMLCIALLLAPSIPDPAAFQRVGLRYLLPAFSVSG